MLSAFGSGICSTVCTGRTVAGFWQRGAASSRPAAPRGASFPRDARRRLVAETHFQFVGVDVDVHARGRERQVQRAHGIQADGDPLAADAFQRLRKQLAAHGTAVDEKRLVRARGLGPVPPRQPGRGCACRLRCGRLRACSPPSRDRKRRTHAVAQIPVAEAVVDGFGRC